MKDKKHIKSFNEATENLNISDVMNSITIEELELIKHCLTDTYVRNEKYLKNENRDKSNDNSIKKENDMIRIIHGKL